jgi:hypothetical protein
MIDTGNLLLFLLQTQDERNEHIHMCLCYFESF